MSSESELVVAVIPAKRRSRRIPNKNLAPLGGLPLVYYSVRIAQVVSSIDAVYVSSEAPEILEVARRYGAATIERPEELAVDRATTRDVLCHAYRSLVARSVTPGIVVLLQPTHPLRMPGDVAGAVEAFAGRPEADSLFTVAPTDALHVRIRDGWVDPELPLPRDRAREPKLYWNTGSVYAFRPERSFLEPGFFGSHIHPFVVQRSEFHVDIDYPPDLRLADHLLAANRELFSHFMPDRDDA